MIDIDTHDFSTPIPFDELSNELHSFAEDGKFDDFLPSALIRFVQDAIKTAYAQGWTRRAEIARKTEDTATDIYEQEAQDRAIEIRVLNARIFELRDVIRILAESC